MWRRSATVDNVDMKLFILLLRFLSVRELCQYQRDHILKITVNELPDPLMTSLTASSWQLIAFFAFVGSSQESVLGS